MKQLVSQLFNINEKFYRLLTADGAEIGHSDLLLKCAETRDHIQLKLDFIADFECLVLYEVHRTVVPASKTTTIVVILEEVLRKFFISQQNINAYQLNLLTESEMPLEMKSSLTLEMIKQEAPIKGDFIQFQLIKK